MLCICVTELQQLNDVIHQDIIRAYHAGQLFSESVHLQGVPRKVEKSPGRPGDTDDEANIIRRFNYLSWERDVAATSVRHLGIAVEILPSVLGNLRDIFKNEQGLEKFSALNG